MKQTTALFLLAFSVTSCATAPAFGQGTVSQETDEHAYDYALNYCETRGGLAQYTVSGSTVKFSCADDLSRVITVNSR